MIYFELFIAYVQIGLMCIGGGYAGIPAIQSIVVDQYAWLTTSQLSDLITIAEMTPGPIAINSATFVGQSVAGFWGAIAATAGFLLPTVTLVLVFGALYYRYRKLEYVQSVLGGLRPGITALIASAGASITIVSLFGYEISEIISSMTIEIDFLAVAIFLGAMVALRINKKLNPIVIILGSGLVGLAAYFIMLI